MHERNNLFYKTYLIINEKDKRPPTHVNGTGREIGGSRKTPKKHCH